MIPPAYMENSNVLSCVKANSYAKIETILYTFVSEKQTINREQRSKFESPCSYNGIAFNHSSEVSCTWLLRAKSTLISLTSFVFIFSASLSILC